MIYEYLYSLFLTKNNVNFDQTYSGQEWFIELFMASQASSSNTKVPIPLIFFSSLVASCAFSIALIVKDNLQDGEEHFSSKFYLYTGMCNFVSTLCTTLNMVLIAITVVDYNRRKQFQI